MNNNCKLQCFDHEFLNKFICDLEKITKSTPHQMVILPLPSWVKVIRASLEFLYGSTSFPQVVDFNKIISVAENLIPVALSFYIGSLSDTYGRKTFIAINMAGKGKYFGSSQSRGSTVTIKEFYLMKFQKILNLHSQRTNLIQYLFITGQCLAENCMARNRRLVV